MKNGRFARYFVVNRAGNRIVEFLASNGEDAVALIASYADRSGQWQIEVNVPPLPVALVRRMAELADSVVLNDGDNWRVFDWEKVVSALMSAAVLDRGLAEGRVTLGIEGYGNLALEIANGKASCAKTTAKSALTLDALKAHRVLLGPLSPKDVIEVPLSARILNDWCPLPLYLAVHDHA
jgi:hypothetical protein